MYINEHINSFLMFLSSWTATSVTPALFSFVHHHHSGVQLVLYHLLVCIWWSHRTIAHSFSSTFGRSRPTTVFALVIRACRHAARINASGLSLSQSLSSHLWGFLISTPSPDGGWYLLVLSWGFRLSLDLGFFFACGIHQAPPVMDLFILSGWSWTVAMTLITFLFWASLQSRGADLG